MKWCRFVILFVVLLGCSTEGDSRLETGHAALELKVPGEFATIQEALNAAAPGDTVSVAPGDYTENLKVFAGVDLKGAGPANTVLHGQVKCGSDGTSVSGFRVVKEGSSGLGLDIGISCTGEIFNVTGNVVEGFGSGIGVESTVDGEISGNLVRNNGIGIELGETAAVLVANNVVTNNSKGGIVLFSGYFGINIVHNTIVGNGFGSNYQEGGAGIVIGPFITETVQNNIVVSNRGGINCMDGYSSKDKANLVWGNLDNYVGGASAGAGDLSLDPMFADPGNKDYRLQAGSPAVNAAILWPAVVIDFDGNPRPTGDAPDLGAFELQLASVDGDFIITEVMANPLAEGSGEFVELFNATSGALDASGLVIDDGDSTDNVVGWDGGSTEVPAGGYAVILDQDYDLAAGPYAIPAEAVLLTVPNKTIGSGLSINDAVTLWRNGAQVSTYSYPFNPGNGLSAEKVVADGEDTPDNWVPSACDASPGKANCISSGEGPSGEATIIITEVMAYPLKQTSEEFVEVYNYGDEPVELAGLHIADEAAIDDIVAVPGKASLLPPGQLGIIIDPDLADISGAPYFLNDEVPVVVTVGTATIGNGLTGDDSLVIMDTDGATVLATFSRPMYIKHQSVECIDPDEGDVFDNWLQCPCPAKHSAGRPNCAYDTGEQVKVPLIEITEVMSNPLDEDKGEFIELYNPGNEPVNLAGFMFSDGDASDVLEVYMPGGSLVIPPKGYGVILDPEYDGTYSIPAAAALMRPQNTTLGNGLSNSDPVTILASDGKTVIAAFSFPFNPGNGISAERKGNSGDIAENWVASTCASGSSPGAANCAAGGEPPPDPTGPLTVISEVMANPIVESTEEFVEIVNTGDETVDLEGCFLSDGDSTDTVHAFNGGPTLLAPGDYAVILDAQYPAQGPYEIPAAALLLTTDDLSIGSGLANNDPITLLESDGVTVMATYANPFNAGNGISVERVDLQAPDAPGNWVVSTCDSGSSPGQVNCAAGEPVAPGITVVDVNSANAVQLQQVTGIGGVTASAIVDYRDANGPYESLLHLTVLDAVTPAKVSDWLVAEEGEDAFVIGLEGVKAIKVFTEVGDLLEQLPAADSPDAGTWDGTLVRIKRAAALTQDDAEGNQDLLFGDWGDQGLYEPNGTAKLPVFLDAAVGQGAYDRDHTDHANAMSDWIKEDGDPYNVPDFYRWNTGLSGWGAVAYGSVFALEALLEVHEGAWRLRVRARADAGIDRLVMIERWLEPDEWQELTWIWSYNYKPAVVQTTFGYTWTLPYRLALAHPCRQYWLDTYGNTIVLPKCLNMNSCTPPNAGGWDLFNVALNEWKETPVDPALGHCFASGGVEYCFTEGEEETGLDIVNNASMAQLKAHCYTTTTANTTLANRPFASIEAYDATSGIGPKSMWALLVCYVRSGDWPPAPPDSIQEVLQQIPGNDGKCKTLDMLEVSWKDGNLFEVCDQGTEYCIKAYTTVSVPPTLSVGDIVSVIGQVQFYEPGNYWQLYMVSYCGSLNIFNDQ